MTVRIVFSSRPAFGHVFAVAPLARAARDAGHEVIFASGEVFLPRLESWGFETSKVGEAIEWGFQEAAARYPELLQPERPEFGGRMFVDVLGPASLKDMTSLIEAMRPDLVVYEATDVGAGVAAAAAGIPAACHSLSVWTDVFIEALRDRVEVLWEAAGREPTIDIGVGDAFLDIWPPSMQTAGAARGAERHWLLRPETWADPAAGVPAWLDAAEPPLVFVSLGTVFWGKELLAKVLEALAGVDCHALVLAGVDASPEEFPADDPRIRVAGFVNQAEVLRRADVVVHHGGAGTMLGSLAQGLPSLVLAEGADRPFTAASLQQSAAGIFLEPRSATADDIAAAVRTLLSDSGYRKRAQDLRAEIGGMPSPEEVVARLEDLVRA